MGVTNVVVAIFYDVFNGLFFDRKTITVFVADLIANMWLMLLPLVDCNFIDIMVYKK